MVSYGNVDLAMGINTTDGSTWTFFHQRHDVGNIYCENYSPKHATAFGFGHALVIGLDTDKILPTFKTFMLYFTSNSVTGWLSSDRQKFGTNLEMIPAVTIQPIDTHWKTLQVTLNDF